MSATAPYAPTYWNHTGRFQELADTILRSDARGKAVDRLRRAAHRYNRLYNDGDLTGIYTTFGVAVKFRGDAARRAIDEKMDTLVLAAAKEMGLAVEGGAA